MFQMLILFEFNYEAGPFQLGNVSCDTRLLCFYAERGICPSLYENTTEVSARKKLPVKGQRLLFSL